MVRSPSYGMEIEFLKPGNYVKNLKSTGKVVRSPSYGMEIEFQPTPCLAVTKKRTWKVWGRLTEFRLQLHPNFALTSFFYRRSGIGAESLQSG